MRSSAIAESVLVLFVVQTALANHSTDTDNSICVESNEEFKTCGSACPATCENMGDRNLICNRQCVHGCFCKDGFVRDSNTNQCVLPQECPEICPENETFQRCGTACPLTCSNMADPPAFCTEQCVVGCFCQNGFVRDELTGKCVSPESCTDLSFTTCFSNEIFMPCNSGKRCEHKCNGARKCRFPDDCFNNCLCKPGFRRDVRTLRCITRDQCKRRPGF